MPSFEAFTGIRYSEPDALGDLVCPPYDVISPEEQSALYDRHEHNAVRLELPRSSDGKEERYARAGEMFRAWLESGILQVDDGPCLYVYRQDFEHPRGIRRRVIGVIGGLKLEPFGKDAGVLPHERTMPGPKKDRLALMNRCPVNVSPIYSIYRGGGALAPFLDSLEHRPTEARFADAAGILHRLWVVRAPAEVEMLSEAISANTLVIADGHHRYETALAYRDEHAGEPGAHDAIMCFCVDADAAELVVLPYHRAVRTVIAPDELRARLIDRFGGEEVSDFAAALESSKSDHPFVFRTGSSDLLVEVSDAEVVERIGERAPAWRSLDVVALHEVVIPELLEGAEAEFTFSRDAGAIAELVAGDYRTGILLRALSAVDVVEVARSGERMPQKASYFWPKAITGLVFRSLR